MSMENRIGRWRRLSGVKQGFNHKSHSKNCISKIKYVKGEDMRLKRAMCVNPATKRRKRKAKTYYMITTKLSP